MLCHRLVRAHTLYNDILEFTDIADEKIHHADINEWTTFEHDTSYNINIHHKLASNGEEHFETNPMEWEGWHGAEALPKDTLICSQSIQVRLWNPCSSGESHIVCHSPLASLCFINREPRHMRFDLKGFKCVGTRSHHPGTQTIILT